MDTTGKTRAEVDALRELAAKAHAEGAYAQIYSGTWMDCERKGRQWAAEELPYPETPQPARMSGDATGEDRI